MNIIKVLSEGLVTGRVNVGEKWQEEDIILEILHTAQSEQIPAIFEGIEKAEGLVKALCQGIDGDNYNRFVNELFRLYLIKYESLLKQPSYQIEDERSFYWIDNLMLDRLTYNVIYYSSNEIGFRTKYHTDYYSNPIKVPAFSVVCVYFETDLNFISIPKDKRVVLMPAFVFAWVINEANKTALKQDITALLQLAGYTFTYSELKVLSEPAKKAIKFWASINAIRATTNLVLTDADVRKDISDLKNGKAFLENYDKINSLWDASEFTVNWLNGNQDYFSAFTLAWDNLVVENSGIDVAEKFPQFYRLVNEIKKTK